MARAAASPAVYNSTTPSDLHDVRFGGVEDALDLRRDLGTFRFVLGLGLALVRNQFRQRCALGALHSVNALGGFFGRVSLALLEDLGLLLAVLPGRGVGMCGSCLLVRQRPFELRLVGLSELRLGDVAFRHLLIGLLFAGR